jgi:hypothetical protein
VSLEDTQKLINGAEVIGAGRTLGMTDDETLETKRATLRRDIERRRKQRADREGNRAQAEQFLADDDASFQTKGRNRTSDQKVRGVRVDEDFPDPFGSFEERIYDDDGVLRETRKAEEDFQTYDADETERFGIKGESSRRRGEADPGLLQERGNYVILNRDTPQEKRYWREGRKVAQTGMRDAASRAERPAQPRYYKKPENAAGSRRPDFGKGSQRDIRIAPNANSAQEAISEARRTRETGKALVQGDSGRFSPTARAASDSKAFSEAQEIGRDFTINGNLGIGDENIGYIQEVRSLGTAGPAGHGFTGNIQVVTPNNANNFGIASPLTREDQVVGYYGEEDGAMVQLGEINSPGTRQALNVPEFTPGQEWVVGNRPNMATPGGTSFGMPQVNIKEQIGLFGERMRGMGMGMEGFGNPRSLPEFEAAVSSILARGQQAGKTFYRFDEAAGKNVVVPQPGIDDVLYGMRYTAQEKQALANALLQLDTSLNRDVNLDRKEAFLDRRPQTLSEQPIYKGVDPVSSTPLEKIKNEKVGRGKKRESVGASLRALNEEAVVKSLIEKGEFATEDGVMLPNAARDIQAARDARDDAKRPFYGAVAGEGAPRAQFIRGGDRGKSLQELQGQFGEEQGRIAFEVEQRALKDEERKRTAPTTDPFAAKQRAADASFEAQGRQAARDFEDVEIARLYSLIKQGKLQVPADSEFVDPNLFATQKQSAVAADPTPKTPGSWMGGPGSGKVVSAWNRDPDPKPTQRIEQAPVPNSISPDPWASSASFDAAIGREIQRRSPQQTSNSKSYMALPDGPKSKPSEGRKRRVISDQINRTNRFKRGGAISAAALGTVLGLSTMGKDEEERNYG